MTKSNLVLVALLGSTIFGGVSSASAADLPSPKFAPPVMGDGDCITVYGRSQFGVTDSNGRAIPPGRECRSMQFSNSSAVTSAFYIAAGTEYGTGGMTIGKFAVNGDDLAGYLEAGMQYGVLRTWVRGSYGFQMAGTTSHSFGVYDIPNCAGCTKMPTIGQYETIAKAYMGNALRVELVATIDLPCLDVFGTAITPYVGGGVVYSEQEAQVDYLTNLYIKGKTTIGATATDKVNASGIGFKAVGGLRINQNLEAEVAYTRNDIAFVLPSTGDKGVVDDRVTFGLKVRN